MIIPYLTSRLNLPRFTRKTIGDIASFFKGTSGAVSQQYGVFPKFIHSQRMSRPGTLCFDDYDAIGFDLDHTLAKYNLTKLFDLTHNSLASYLVEQKGYDKSLLEPFSMDKEFLCKGLVLDTAKGNFLKLSEDGTIIRASHGTRFLTDEQIQDIYGKDQHWKEFERLCTKVDNIGEDYRIFENFFDMCGVVVSARVIDLIDKQAKEPVKSYNFFSDIIASLVSTYDSDNFKAEKGGYFPAIKNNIEQYVYPCSQEIKQWLTMLRDNNKTVFLMTSSYMDYATLVLEHILGSDWQKYFDLTITFAKKPSFFHAGRDFLRVEGFEEKEAVSELELGQFYSQGNYHTLMRFFTKVTGKDEPQVLYFGDSLRSDAFPSKNYANWETVLVIEEMEAEGLLGYPRNDEESKVKKAKLEMGPSELEKEYILSAKWGSLFTDDRLPGNGDKQMNTLWGYITRKYADISIPQLDYIADLGIKHKFDIFDHTNPKSWGFYPGIPRSLVPESQSH